MKIPLLQNNEGKRVLTKRDHDRVMTPPLACFPVNSSESAVQRGNMSKKESNQTLETETEQNLAMSANQNQLSVF